MGGDVVRRSSVEGLEPQQSPEAVAWSASDYYWPIAEFQGQKQATV